MGRTGLCVRARSSSLLEPSCSVLRVKAVLSSSNTMPLPVPPGTGPHACLELLLWPCPNCGPNCAVALLRVCVLPQSRLCKQGCASYRVAPGKVCADTRRDVLALRVRSDDCGTVVLLALLLMSMQSCQESSMDGGHLRGHLF